MRLLIITLTAVILFCGCEKQKEKVEKFIFDNKQISTKTIHTYSFYSDGKIKTDYAQTYYLMLGVPYDTTISHEQYKYNSKDRIESIFSLVDSTKQLKFYNEFDSLFRELTINQFGDTTFFKKTDFRDGKAVRIIHRLLSPKIIENPDNKGGYDTLYFESESVYNNGRLTKTIAKDINGRTTEENEFIYDGDKKTKVLKYAFLVDTKYLRETTSYLNSSSEESDYITMGMQNDTLSYKQTVFQDNMRVVINYDRQFNSQDIWYYNNKNQLIGIVRHDFTDRVKQFNSCKYDDMGHIIEESRYIERFSIEQK